MSSIFHGPIGNHLGFHGVSVNSPYGFESIEFCLSNKEWNLSVALNMIPLIGNLVAGFVHFKNPDPLLRNRGIVEMTIIGGMLLAIADIVVTIGRRITKVP